MFEDSLENETVLFMIFFQDNLWINFYQNRPGNNRQNRLCRSYFPVDQFRLFEVRDVPRAFDSVELGARQSSTHLTTDGERHHLVAFPPHQQQQVRMQMSVCLEGVLCQTLLPKAKGSGRIMAMELMPVNSAIRNIIREGKTHQIPNIIQAGASIGMLAMDMSLRNLYLQGMITFEDAISKAASPDEFTRLVGEIKEK